MADRSVNCRPTSLPEFVPLLDVALAACTGMGVNVEIKNSPDDVDFDPARSLADAVVAELDGFGRERVLVTSFDLDTIDRVHALDATLPTGLLTYELDEPAPAIETAASHGHRAINPWDPFVDARFMTLARGAGLDVNVWTVNDVARMRELIELDVDAIITDVPDVLHAAAALNRSADRLCVATVRVAVVHTVPASWLGRRLFRYGQYEVDDVGLVTEAQLGRFAQVVAVDLVRERAVARDDAPKSGRCGTRCCDCVACVRRSPVPTRRCRAAARGRACGS